MILPAERETGTMLVPAPIRETAIGLLREDLNGFG
jgi:hypothetical protein